MGNFQFSLSLWNFSFKHTLTRTLRPSNAKAHKGRFALLRFLGFVVQKTQWFILKWFPEIFLIPLYGQHGHYECLTLTYGELCVGHRIALAESSLNHWHRRIFA